MTENAADGQALAERSVASLYATDHASQAFGMRIASVAPGECSVTMTVRKDMTNGHGTCHGGMLFTLADSAFAFACNSSGVATVAASASIDFLAAAREGDVLTARARALWHGGRSGIYEITITNQNGAQVALFRGRSHRIGERPATGRESP